MFIMNTPGYEQRFLNKPLIIFQNHSTCLPSDRIDKKSVSVRGKNKGRIY